MQLLLEDNPFFVLGLPPDTSRIEIEREAQKLLGMLELGFTEARSYRTRTNTRDKAREAALFGGPSSAVNNDQDCVDRVTGAHLRQAACFDGGALRATLDPWGPLTPAALELMRQLRDEFDPGRVLNPGRFVGGL